MHHRDRIEEPSCTKTTLKKNEMGRLIVPVWTIKYRTIVNKMERYPNNQDHLKQKKNNAGGTTVPDFKLLQT